MAANKGEGIADAVVDQLLEGRDPATVFESGGLVDELKKRLAERMLNGEMEHHLGAEAENEAGNQLPVRRHRPLTVRFAGSAVQESPGIRATLPQS